MTSWPDWFPSDCPPAQAREAVGRFYRLVDDVTPTEQDFWSARELVAAGIKRRQHWSDDQEWKAVACSVYADLKDAQSARDSFGALKAKVIAGGDIDGPGKVLDTPSQGNSHHSWWRNRGDQAWMTFEVDQ